MVVVRRCCSQRSENSNAPQASADPSSSVPGFFQPCASSEPLNRSRRGRAKSTRVGVSSHRSGGFARPPAAAQSCSVRGLPARGVWRFACLAQLAQTGFGPPTPRRRTCAAPILGFAYSMLTALRHPWLRWSATPAPGAWAALRLGSPVSSTSWRPNRTSRWVVWIKATNQVDFGGSFGRAVDDTSSDWRNAAGRRTHLLGFFRRIRPCKCFTAFGIW